MSTGQIATRTAAAIPGGALILGTVLLLTSP